jgi:alginate O-acetyltransferase complex protein AlgI
VENFNSPYKSLSITDFWRRWHMSLSNFLRDYLYIPLGGNRKGPTRTYVNLMLTMLIGGLWHGAQWTFVIWGAMHGGLLALERMFGLGATSVRKVGKGVTGESTAVPSGMVPVRTAITFVIILFTWVFFRAENFEVATRYLSAMFGQAPIKPTAALVESQMLTGFNIAQFIIAWLGVFAFPNTQTILHRFTLWKAALGLVLFVAAVTMMFARGYSPFLYFQF